MAGLRAVPRRLREQGAVRRGVQLGGAGRVPGSSRAVGGGSRGAGSRGGLQGASVGGLVRRHGVVPPERTRAGGAGRVRARGLAVTPLALAAGFGLVVSVGWGHGWTQRNAVILSSCQHQRNAKIVHPFLVHTRYHKSDSISQINRASAVQATGFAPDITAPVNAGSSCINAYLRSSVSSALSRQPEKKGPFQDAF